MLLVYVVLGICLFCVFLKALNTFLATGVSVAKEFGPIGCLIYFVLAAVFIMTFVKLFIQEKL